MPAFDVARRWKGRVVLDRTGDKLGSVLDVFYDAENDEPGWVLLGEAGTGAGARLVPVAEAIEHGNELRVPFDRAFVEGAPGMEPGGRHAFQQINSFEIHRLNAGIRPHRKAAVPFLRSQQQIQGARRERVIPSQELHVLSSQGSPPVARHGHATRRKTRKRIREYACRTQTPCARRKVFHSN